MFIMDWWNALTGAQQGFMFAAIPATLVLVIQTVLIFVGMGSGGEGVDLDGDGIPDGIDLDGDGVPDGPADLDGDLRVFTVRGFVAFFAVFGWTGAAILGGGLPLWFASVGALAAGAAAMVLIALLMKAMLKLQQSGNINPKNAVGKAGVVYITIPAAREGSGKVNLVLQERYSEMEAITDSETPIPTGREVTVVSVTTLGTLVVKEK